MTYTFRLAGKMLVDLPPAECALSGQFKDRALLCEQILLKSSWKGVISLSSDVATPISFNGMAGVSVVSLRVITPNAGRVLATIVHADGAGEVVPIDQFFLLISQASPLTAISLTRAVGVAADVEALLGELSV